MKAQKPSGLWNADYSKDNGADDIEASVWQILALKSAIMAGLNQDALRPALQVARQAITLTIEPSISKKKSAPATYCVQITGCGTDTATSLGLNALEGVTANWEVPGYYNPVYQWFFICQAKFRQGGKAWMEWNRRSGPSIVTNQTVEGARDGTECGFWVSPGKGERYGKVCSTALCCMTLQCRPQYRPYYAPPSDGRNPVESDATNDVVIKVQ